MSTPDTSPFRELFSSATVVLGSDTLGAVLRARVLVFGTEIRTSHPSGSRYRRGCQAKREENLSRLPPPPSFGLAAAAVFMTSESVVTL